MSTAVIGNVLKEARTKKSLSLDEVHAKIKIHPRVLQLLEEGKFEKLPSPLFAKSFLRSYAEFLGVNPEEVMDAYGKEGESVRKEPEQVLFIKTVDERKEENWAQKNIVKTVVFIAVLVIGGLLISFVFKHASAWTRNIKLSNPIAGLAPKTGKAQPNRVSVKTAVAETSIKEVKKNEEFVRSFELGNFPKISKKTALELRLRALDNVWVRVNADGKIMYQGILGRNAVDTWTAKNGFEIWTGNAANMFLSVNRSSLGSPGKGMVRKMIITREGVRIAASENR